VLECRPNVASGAVVRLSVRRWDSKASRRAMMWSVGRADHAARAADPPVSDQIEFVINLQTASGPRLHHPENAATADEVIQ